MGNVEQAERIGKGRINGHRFVKNQKNRYERRICKDSLQKNEQPADTYKKYKGWEL